MYIDGYVVSSLVIIALTVLIVGYMAWFGYRHIKQDMDKSGRKTGGQSGGSG